MKDIEANCDKTIVKTKDNIKDTETHLKNIIPDTEKTINNNEANTKRLLQQRKSKKFNYLKCKANSATEETLNQLNIKQNFKKNMQVLYKVLTTLTPV